MKTKSPMIAGVLISAFVAGPLSLAQPGAHRAVTPKQIADQPEPQVQELTQIAEQEEKRADQNQEQVRQAAYTSDIRAAAGLIAMAKQDAAREMLIKIPPSLRRWEWGHFMELCGPPAWRIELGPEQPTAYHPLNNISQALAPVIARFKEDADQEHEGGKIKCVASQTFPLIAIIGHGGRHGAYLCVLRKEANTDYATLDPEQLVHSRDPRVIFSVWSGNYESIEAAQITSDGSLLLVKAPRCATLSPSPTVDISVRVAGGRESESSIHVFPLPACGAENTLEAESPASIRTPWQRMRFAELGAETRDLIFQFEQRDNAQEHEGCRYADHLVRKDGTTLVLFNAWNKEWSGEIVEFPTGKLISKFGSKVEGGKPQDSEMADQGGAFNADGSLVVLCPSGLPGSPPAPAVHWPEPDGTAAIFESKSGQHRSTLCLGGRYNYGRHADPVWGFSQDSRMVFQSSMEVAGLENIITICRVADGTAVDKVPRHLRSIAWSPDSSFMYFIEGNGSAVEVVESATLKKISSIPGAVKSSAYPDYAAMRTASTIDLSRFAIGRLLFANDPTTPLVWLEDDAKAPLRSWLLDALHGVFPSNLTLADAALLYWVQQCDKR